MKYKLTATIPVVQYGNLTPEIELEGDDFKKLHSEAIGYIKSVWDKHGEVPMRVNRSTANQFKTFTGEEVLFDEESHSYTDINGNPLISGSKYKQQFEKPFPADIIIPKVAKKYNVKAEDIKAMWKDNGKVSRTFGNALHYAMRQWFQYKDSACDEKEYNLPKHPFLNNAVKTFPLKDSEILPEILVSDVKKKMVGQVDGLEVIKDKTGELLDYKTDADIEKNLIAHFNQLSFYAHILIAFGWTIEKVMVWNYTDKWERYDSKVLPLEGEFKK